MKNVCIVGYGAIGPIHAAALEKVKNARLYAVCDCDEERILRCTEKYDVVTYTDFGEMLNDENIDSVHICTPHYLHFDMVRKALEKNKEVVCEKPLAMDNEQFEKMLKLPGVEKVAVCFQNRLNTCVLKMKELLASGKMGEVLGVRGLLTWIRDKAYYDTDEWRGKWETEGGGVLINQAIHTLDLMGYFTGGFKSLKAVMNNFSLEDIIEVEDSFMASLRTNADAKAVFFATNAFSSNSTPDIQVVCEKGTLHYTDDKLFLDDEMLCHDVTAEGEKAYWGTGHIALLKEYYDHGKYFTVFDSANTMKTVFAMYESAGQGGKEIHIK